MRFLCLLATVLVVAGCPVGRSAGGFHPANQPAGVIVRVAVERQTVEGELLALARDGMVLLRDGTTVLRVPYAVVRSVKPRQMGVIDIPPRVRDPGRYLVGLRRLSRFPQGLSESLLGELLKAYGQDSLLVVTPP